MDFVKKAMSLRAIVWIMVDYPVPKRMANCEKTWFSEKGSSTCICNIEWQRCLGRRFNFYESHV